MKKAESNGKIWLKKEMRPYRASVLFLTFLTLFATALTLAFAYLVRYLINSATDKKTSLMWCFSAVLLGILLLKIFIKTFDGFYAEKLRAKITAKLRTKTFSKILRSDYASTQKYHSGDMLNRLTSDINEVAVDTVGLLPTLAGMLLQCVGAVAALITIDPFFTAIYVVCGVIFGGITALFRKYIKRCHKDFMKADGEFRAFMQEGLGSSMTLKAYGAEEKATKKAEEFATDYYKKRMKRNVLRALMNGVFNLLSNFGLIFAIVWCSYSLLKGYTEDYGSILSVILLLMQFQQPLTAFSSVIPVYYARIASGERLSEIDEMPDENLATEQEKQWISYKNTQRILLENVDFSYGRDSILNKVNLSLEKGEIVCLTGASGSGKSTLFKLLLSVYKPTGGALYLEGDFDGEQRILLDEKVRDLFAYVPQGNFLFSGTIYENLTFFTNEHDELTLQNKIKNALKTACAEFVFDLPNGLQTSLKERGAGLSEGQLQRLAVARAVLSDKPILLLDEATSALDAETEKQLLENIRNLQDKTCLIVTHRAAALEIADRVLTIENGKIF